MVKFLVNLCKTIGGYGLDHMLKNRLVCSLKPSDQKNCFELAAQAIHGAIFAGKGRNSFL
jgi:hypothetical protein